jgi:hypothetical protein
MADVFVMMLVIVFLYAGLKKKHADERRRRQASCRRCRTGISVTSALRL